MKNNSIKALKRIAASVFAGCIIAASFTACGSKQEEASDLHDVMTRLSDGQIYEGGADYSNAGYNENISVPGYDTLEFTADQKEQSVLLHNPEENTCCFDMSLTLEDGTVIWQADSKLEPGIAFTSIILEKPLKEGVYENVKLTYKCCTLTDHAALNGSEIVVKINAVKEKK